MDKDEGCKKNIRRNQTHAKKQRRDDQQASKHFKSCISKHVTCGIKAADFVTIKNRIASSLCSIKNISLILLRKGLIFNQSGHSLLLRLLSF